ncbi:hypothetical protein GWI33_017428 [Rhynchophorus ferrugineus]|uniref:Uncharacterized protein n=1 Tax=Rhynchophorus ferrugineus TaxID=354439 RepID=A0A834M954_RHYFE|nr:hypothetical protein GWI33_017428 [Rhynchophorus ferrugineus]
MFRVTIQSLVLLLIIVVFQYYLIGRLNQPEIGFVWWENVMFAIMAGCYLFLLYFTTERFWQVYFEEF